MRCKSIFILVFAVLFTGIISASFNFSASGSLITSQYEVGDTLEADINISFFNESLDSTFSDSLGNSIKLGALLSEVPGYDTIPYDITNTTVSSAFQLLDLGKADFDMPSGTGNITYKLYLRGIKFFETGFQISKRGCIAS